MLEEAILSRPHCRILCTHLNMPFFPLDQKLGCVSSRTPSSSSEMARSTAGQPAGGHPDPVLWRSSRASSIFRLLLPLTSKQESSKPFEGKTGESTPFGLRAVAPVNVRPGAARVRFPAPRRGPRTESHAAHAPRGSPTPGQDSAPRRHRRGPRAPVYRSSGVRARGRSRGDASSGLSQPLGHTCAARTRSRRVAARPSDLGAGQ